MLEHFGFPCEPPEYGVIIKCPRCGEELCVEIDEVFKSKRTRKIVGCKNCLIEETLYKED